MPARPYASCPFRYTTRRNARAAEWLAATRESRRRREPEPCDQCRGFHLAEAAAMTTTGDPA